MFQISKTKYINPDSIREIYIVDSSTDLSYMIEITWKGGGCTMLKNEEARNFKEKYSDKKSEEF